MTTGRIRVMTSACGLIDSVDPDFTGTEANADNPILVVYEWKRDDDVMPDNGDETLLSVSAGEPATYTVTQEDVGMVIQGTVTYFELFDGMIVQTENMPALDARSMVVQDRPDDATGTITFGATNAEDELVATVMRRWMLTATTPIPMTMQRRVTYTVGILGQWPRWLGRCLPITMPWMVAATEQTTTIGADQEGMHIRLVVDLR